MLRIRRVGFLLKTGTSAKFKLLTGAIVAVLLVQAFTISLKPMIVFSIYMAGVANFWSGSSIYIQDPTLSGLYKYSPFVCVLLTPLYILPEQLGRFLWGSINIALFLATPALLLTWVNEKISFRQKSWIWFAVVALSLEVLHINMRMGEINYAVIFLIAMGLHLQINKTSQVWGAFSIALAGAIKIFPYLFTFYFLLKRQWKAAAYVLAWGIFMMTIPALWLGWEANMELLGQWKTLLERDAANPTMQLSLWAFLNLYFLEHDIAFKNGPDMIHLYWFSKEALKAIWFACLAAFTALFVATAYRNSACEKLSIYILFELSLIVVSVLLFSDTTESHTRGLLMPVFVFLLVFYRVRWVLASLLSIWLLQSLGKDLLGDELSAMLYGAGSMNLGLILFAILLGFTYHVKLRKMDTIRKMLRIRPKVKPYGTDG